MTQPADDSSIWVDVDRLFVEESAFLPAAHLKEQ